MNPVTKFLTTAAAGGAALLSTADASKAQDLSSPKRNNGAVVETVGYKVNDLLGDLARANQENEKYTPPVQNDLLADLRKANQEDAKKNTSPVQNDLLADLRKANQEDAKKNTPQIQNDTDVRLVTNTSKESSTAKPTTNSKASTAELAARTRIATDTTNTPEFIKAQLEERKELLSKFSHLIPLNVDERNSFLERSDELSNPALKSLFLGTSNLLEAGVIDEQIKEMLFRAENLLQPARIVGRASNVFKAKKASLSQTKQFVEKFLSQIKLVDLAKNNAIKSAAKK